LGLGFIKPKLLTTIAKTTAETEDIRYAIHLLLRAAAIVEENQKQTITTNDITSAIEEENTIRKSKQLADKKYEILRIRGKLEKD